MTRGAHLAPAVAQDRPVPGVEVVDEQEVDLLAARIREGNRRVSVHGRAALHAAMDAGDAIATARRLIPSGEWTRWIEENTGVAQSTARLYERLALGRAHIESAGDLIQTIGEATKILQLDSPKQASSRTGRPSGRPNRIRATGHTEVHQPGRPARVEINDKMIERAAKWLAVRFPEHTELRTTAGGATAVSAQAREKAHELLLYALNNEAPTGH